MVGIVIGVGVAIAIGLVFVLFAVGVISSFPGV